MSPISEDPKAVNISNVFSSEDRTHMDERTYDVDYTEYDWTTIAGLEDKQFNTNDNVSTNIVNVLKRKRDTLQ